MNALQNLIISKINTQNLDDKDKEALKIVLENEYIKRKYNRERRFIENCHYIQNNAIEIFSKENLRILDLGPGPGEFLEICNLFGHTTFGIDAKLEDCEMGDEYVKLSYLLSKCQNINTKYVGFENIINNSNLFDFNNFNIINSRGSIEQILKSQLEGTPHKVHKNCMLLSWREDKETISRIEELIKYIYNLLTKDGIFVLHCNGSKNHDFFFSVVKDICNKINFHMDVVSKDKKFIKFRK